MQTGGVSGTVFEKVSWSLKVFQSTLKTQTQSVFPPVTHSKLKWVLE